MAIGRYRRRRIRIWIGTWRVTNGFINFVLVIEWMPWTINERSSYFACKKTTNTYRCLQQYFWYTSLVRKISLFCVFFITALHRMQTQSSDENSVRLSVCPSICPYVRLSNAWIVTKRNKNQSKYLYHTEKNSSPSFLKRRMVAGATLSTWNFGLTGPRWSEIADFEPIIARSASAVTPSEKSSINTNRKTPTCFPIRLRWSLYVATTPPKGAKNAKVLFFV